MNNLKKNEYNNDYQVVSNGGRIFMSHNKYTSNAVIKVIGVGGGGGNALNTMIESGLSGVEFIAANTDVQALQANLAPIKLQLGKELTKGLGAGANPETGRNAALEDKAILQEVLAGADMVFVTGGMGGGTGTGAAPIIAQVAREMGALTVGVVTKPFSFEGKRRKHQSENGIQALRQSVDTLITIPNQRLLSLAPPEMSMLEGFKLADEILLNAVKGISDIINIPGRVNVDFADVKTIMSEMGMALMGIGSAKGTNRATEAAKMAINSPLLEDIDIEGATGILINITGTSSMTLHEISEASTLIQEAAHEDANIIFGAVIDESMGECVRVTVIATGFDQARISYPEQNQNFNAIPQSAQFNNNLHTGHQQPTAGQTFTTLNSVRGNSVPQNMYGQQNLNQTNSYENRTNNQQPLFGRSQNQYQQNNLNQQKFASQGGVQNNIRPQDSVTQGAYKAPMMTPFTPTQSKEVHSPQTSHWPTNSTNQHQEQEITQKEPINMTAPSSVEERIGATLIDPNAIIHENTENAIKIANDLSSVEIDKDDFETPAFMRRKEESERGL